jgi:formamidopyrimidine-DNA glycosylase
MPELPEVESVRRQLAPRLSQRVIVSVQATPQTRFSDLHLAQKTRVAEVRRRGKYLLLALEATAGDVATADRELVIHLGMTGSLRFRGEDGWAPDAYVRASFTLEDGGVLDFRDVRRFGRLSVVPAGDHRTIATLHALGPEPLDDGFDPTAFHRILAASRAPIKPLLLSQRPVAGVGNIYADEALWRARIHPNARRLGRERAYRLWQAIREVLTEAVEREGTTFRDYLMVNGQAGRNADFLVAYGQGGRACPRCDGTLRKITLGGRGTTYCPNCQRH